MFERFTDRARRVVVLAQEEARLLSDDIIGTEHLLLALLAEGEGIAAQVLTKYFSVEALRETMGRGDGTPTGHIPFTPESKRALEASLREALQLGHNYIGTEHILLGLLRVEDGAAYGILEDRVGLALVRRDVIKILSEGGMLTEKSTTNPFDRKNTSIIGEVVGVDFTKRNDGNIIVQVAVPEGSSIGRQRVAFFPEHKS